MKLLGHMSAEMNKGYTHHDLEPWRAAVAVIPSRRVPPGKAKFVFGI
jgi:hypothetical protein